MANKVLRVRIRDFEPDIVFFENINHIKVDNQKNKKINKENRSRKPIKKIDQENQ